MSGLNIGSPWCDCCTVQMFIDFVCGQIGDDNSVSWFGHALVAYD